MKVRELIHLLNLCDETDEICLETEAGGLYSLASLYNDRGRVVLTDARLTR